MEWVIGIAGLVVGGVIGAAAVLLRQQAAQRSMHTDLANANARALSLETQARAALDEAQHQREQWRAADQAREAAEKRAAVITTELEAKRQQIDEQRLLLAEAEKKLSDTFASLGSKALRDNNAQFLDLAKQVFEKLMKEASGDVEKKQQAIDNLVKPIKELLEKQNTAVAELEKKREADKGGLEKHLQMIATAHDKLTGETSRLVTALRKSDVRGRWGEMQLRNAVELAGMTAHCDFQEQVQTDDPTTRDRPDMIVRLPGGGVIVVDSKVALEAYLDAIQPGADRDAQMRRHADHVQTHCDRLAHKRYWEQFERTPKAVVMFMPLESALIAALEVKPNLHADAMQQHVLIATPTLLVALLRAVAYGWQQEDVAANARQIQQVGQELYDRLATFVENFEGVGRGLTTAGTAYNKAIGSLESRVLPSARKLKELHTTTADAIDSPPPIEIEVRTVTAPELKSLPQ